MRPFTSCDEAWAALEAMRSMSDGEAVDLREHQLQTAARLFDAGAGDELVVAGLLHDLGDGRVAERIHASWAAAIVRPLLGERVAWLVGAHVDAKRYLCDTEPGYAERVLSEVSRRTLALQGGGMSPEERAAFERHPLARDAILLRRCDDAGKRPDVTIEDPERFREILERVAHRYGGRTRS